MFYFSRCNVSASESNISLLNIAECSLTSHFLNAKVRHFRRAKTRFVICWQIVALNVI